LAGVHVFEAAEIQIRDQILDPCLLVDSGLRHYEIKLDRGFSSVVIEHQHIIPPIAVDITHGHTCRIRRAGHQVAGEL
jgi:hypothetical protein